MAETEANSNTTLVWISLDFVFARLRARCPCFKATLPSNILRAGFEVGLIRGRAWHYKNRIAGDPGIDEPAFWRGDPTDTAFNPERGFVRRYHGGWEGKGYVAYQVEIVSADIDALIAAYKFPEPTPAPELQTPPPPPPSAIPTTTTTTTSPTPAPVTSKEAARMEPLQWLAHAVVRFPEQAGEQRGDYFDRLEVKMRRELKGKALKAVSIGRQLYAINALPRRQPRPKKTLTNSH